MKALKGTIKPFEGPQRSVKTKIYVLSLNFLSYFNVTSENIMKVYQGRLLYFCGIRYSVENNWK